MRAGNMYTSYLNVGHCVIHSYHTKGVEHGIVIVISYCKIWGKVSVQIYCLFL